MSTASERSSSANPVSASDKSLDVSCLREKVEDTKLRLKAASRKIEALDREIRELNHRYHRAVRHKKSAFRYNLRLRISVLSGRKIPPFRPLFLAARDGPLRPSAKCWHSGLLTHFGGADFEVLRGRTRVHS